MSAASPPWLRPVESERLRLVPAQAEHAEAFADAAMESDRELSQWARPGGTRDHAGYGAKALARATTTASGAFVHRYGFTREVPGRLVAGASLHPWRDPRAEPQAPGASTRVDESPELELGCWCRTSMVGKGYASETASALVRHAFEDLRAATVWARTSEENVRSRRLAERIGFVEVERVTFPASAEWGDAATVLFMRRDR